MQATINQGKTQKTLQQGDKGTYSGFPATIVRHYSGNMYEIRMPGGVACVDAYYFMQNERPTLPPQISRAANDSISWQRLK